MTSRWKTVDLFPKLEDYVLQEATVRGALFSVCAFACMVSAAPTRPPDPRPSTQGVRCAAAAGSP